MSACQTEQNGQNKTYIYKGRKTFMVQLLGLGGTQCGPLEKRRCDKTRTPQPTEVMHMPTVNKREKLTEEAEMSKGRET